MRLFLLLHSPAVSLGLIILVEIFAYVTVEVVTLRLCGWCMLGVFLLLAFIRLGHECQDLLRPCDRMHVCTVDLVLYYHPKEFWGNGVRTHVNSKGKIPSTGSSEED